MNRDAVLLIDAGNTHLDIAVAQGQKLLWRQQVAHRQDPAWATRLGTLIRQYGPNTRWQGAAIASVVPSLNDQLDDVCSALTGTPPLWIDRYVTLGITLDVAAPEQVGNDRLATAAGAYLAYGGPLLVVDVGTAITTCVVTADGRYLGGAIAPGPAVALTALVAQTEQLPEIPLTPPDAPIGDTTVTAMQAGLVWGYAGLIDRLIEMGRQGMGSETAPVIYLTGGAAGLLSDHIRATHRWVPDLTLQGLQRLFAQNRKQPQE